MANRVQTAQMQATQAQMQGQTQGQALPTGHVSGVGAGPQEVRQAEVESLAVQLFVEMIAAGRHLARTPAHIAGECFGLASDFLDARDARRESGRAGTQHKQAG